MVTVEELEARIALLEKKYANHKHNGYNGMTKPFYDYHCPRCSSFNKPVEKGKSGWYCPDCGRKYEHGDFAYYFCGVPTTMPDERKEKPT